MEEKWMLTPEQLFFLGTLMEAEHIDYDYIAALQELQRNYPRTRRKCISELSQAGILRERLSGEITLRPAPEKLLKNVFFGKTETILEVYTLEEPAKKEVTRFHWLEGTVTQVRTCGAGLELSGSNEAQLQALTTRLTQLTVSPEPVQRIVPEDVTRIITAKQAKVGVGSTGLVLFEVRGSLYTVDTDGKPTGIPGRQAQELLLSVLKGE